jgi:hypothetical protein
VSRASAVARFVSYVEGVALYVAGLTYSFEPLSLKKNSTKSYIAGAPPPPSFT